MVAIPCLSPSKHQTSRTFRFFVVILKHVIFSRKKKKSALHNLSSVHITWNFHINSAATSTKTANLIFRCVTILASEQHISTLLVELHCNFINLPLKMQRSRRKFKKKTRRIIINKTVNMNRATASWNKMQRCQIWQRGPRFSCSLYLSQEGMTRI
jgi:HSP90 family molecular chaperone